MAKKTDQPKVLPAVTITAKKPTPPVKVYAKQDSINLTPKGRVAMGDISKLQRMGAGKAIGQPIMGKYPAQQSDNIKQLLSKKK